MNDGQTDVVGYNDELEALGPSSWFNVPWLYAECYLYRYDEHQAKLTSN